MMRIKFYAAALPALALVLASCNNDGVDNPLADGPVPMSFTADISSVATRATANGFENGDVVGIIPLKDGSVETGQANIAYTYNGGAFTATPPYYFQNRDKVTFNAYYPYQETLAAPYEVEVDTRGENQIDITVNGRSWRKNDFLFASAETDVTTPAISFTTGNDNPFRHVMSSVAIKFIAGTEDGVDHLGELRGYALDAVVEGTFNCLTGKASIKEDATVYPILINGIPSGAVKEYTAHPLILLPQKVNGGKLPLFVHFSHAVYKAELSLTELIAGKLHVFPVTIKNTELEIGTAEIKDWETQPEQNGSATLP